MESFLLLSISFPVVYLEVTVFSLCLIAIIWLLIEFRQMKKKINDRLSLNNEAMRLQLEAIERLTLYAERAGLKNLVSRIYNGGSVGSLHDEMIEAIKTEYNYNVTQQVYVSPEVWNAVTRLKDQNIYIINQLAAGLSPQESGIELSKRILEFSMAQEKDLYHIVQEALQFEAKKIMKP